jgi:hypothetical protein
MLGWCPVLGFTSQIISFGIVLTRMPLRSIKDQCQETHYGAAKGSRPLEGSLHADGAEDRANT